jgi:hypothetical protein
MEAKSLYGEQTLHCCSVKSQATELEADTGIYLLQAMLQNAERTIL